MEIRRVPPEEAAIRRFVEELWIPYSRDLAAAVADHALADDVTLVDEQTDFWFERFGDEGREAWVVVDRESNWTDDGPDRNDDEPNGADYVPGETDSRPADDGTAPPLAETDGDLVGFIKTGVDESPSVFDRPDRLVVGDFYVSEPYRGTGLARDLLDLAVERAREAGCSELALDVDVDNERALAFYEKVGFEPRRYRMRAPVENL